MFLQGDRERALGQPVSPLMDRTKGGVTKSQTGFFSIVALPIYQVCGCGEHGYGHCYCTLEEWRTAHTWGAAGEWDAAAVDRLHIIGHKCSPLR